MAKHLDSGVLGEGLAVSYLSSAGYEILHRNWRFKHLEVDVVAKDKDVLVFVEVKSRTSQAFGLPYEFVDLQKRRKLIRAADFYIQKYSYLGEIRFDIVSVYLKNKKVELIKDAFWND